MKVLILGMGQQGRAALYHLACSHGVDEIVAADRDLERAEVYAGKFSMGKTRCVGLNAEDAGSLLGLMESGVDVVVDLLPVFFIESVAELALKAGVHLVNASYATPRLLKLDKEAKERGISILPEFGMDPGIDLVMCAKALGELDEVESLHSYGAGFPEPEPANNPLRYKITWTFDGVLRSYKRAARILQDGKTIDIPANEIFAAHNIHTLRVEGLGELEAFPNGDALRYNSSLTVRFGRYWGV